MTLHLRIYVNEHDATDVGNKLAAAGFDNSTVFLASECRGREAAAVDAAIGAGTMPERKSKFLLRHMREGRSIVSVETLFGRGGPALDIMNGPETVGSDVLDRFYSDDAAPISELLSIPVLSDVSPSSNLLPSNWSLSSKFGMGMLSSKAAPLSAMIGMKPLSAAKKNWQSSFGMSLLSKNAAPLSSMLGMKTLTKQKEKGLDRFGMPLLSHNPSPLSNLFCIPTLSKRG